MLLVFLDRFTIWALAGNTAKPKKKEISIEDNTKRVFYSIKVYLT